MIPNPIIILGSSRRDGNTSRAVRNVIGDSQVPVVDLLETNISYYDYEHKNQNDNYLTLMERIISHDLIILATPVYWYTMSAQMKVFIDRLSDLLTIAKDTGRKLRGKNLFVIASYGTSVPKGFEDAFEQTCEYMGMHYLGTSFIYSGEDNNLQAMNSKQINKAHSVISPSPAPAGHPLPTGRGMTGVGVR